MVLGAWCGDEEEEEDEEEEVEARFGERGGAISVRRGLLMGSIS